MAAEIFALTITWWTAFALLGFSLKGRWDLAPSLSGVGLCGFLAFASWGWLNGRPGAAPPAPNLGEARFALVEED